MRKCFSSMLIIAFISSWVFGQENASSQIDSLLEEYYSVMTSRDWLQYKSFFIEDATLTTIWQAESDSFPGIYSVTIDEFLDQTAEGPDSQPIFEEKMLEAETTVRGGLAQSWVKYEAKFGTKENLMEWKGTDLFTLIRFNEKWQIVSLAYLSN